MLFTKDHEWIRLDDDTATIGVTHYAQEQLGDVVFVDLPEIGKSLTRGGEAAVVESVKTASELYAPADGEIVVVNNALTESPALVNSDPMGDGWFFRMKLSDPTQLDGLMDEAAYQSFIEGLA